MKLKPSSHGYSFDCYTYQQSVQVFDEVIFDLSLKEMQVLVYSYCINKLGDTESYCINLFIQQIRNTSLCGLKQEIRKQ